LELFIQVYASQVRMTCEADAIHVPGLTLEPVGADPYRGDAGYARAVAGDARLQAQALVVRCRVQMIDELEALGVPDVIHRRDIEREIEAQGGIVAHEAGDVDDAVGGDGRTDITAIHVVAQDVLRKARTETIEDRMLGQRRCLLSDRRFRASAANAPARAC